MNDKYISGHRAGGGFNNILIVLENALAASFISNRKIFLYDYKHDGPFSHIPIDPRESIWSVLDINNVYKNFLCVDPNDYDSWDSFDFSKNVDSAKTCYYNSSLINDDYDFKMFTKNRPIIDIGNLKDKIISFSFFDFYYYKLYTGDVSIRNELKNKINNSIVYKEKYISLAKSLIKEKYNSVHIRYPSSGYPDIMQKDSNPITLYNQLKLLFDREIPLFISTDFKSTGLLINKINIFDEYIAPIKKNFKKVILLEDFGLNTTHTENIALDQLLCVNSDIFYGNYYSTFSKRINVMRGHMGKPTYDYMGWNKIQTSWQEEDVSYPWNKLNGEWPWHFSSYLSYNKE